MNRNEEFFSQEAKQASSAASEKLAPLKGQETEEEKIKKLQRLQRKDSIDALGFDVQDASCPKCHERNSMIIVDKGTPPRFLGLVSLLLPRLKNCGATLHCFACGQDIKMPSLKGELLIPALVLLFIALVIAGDILLMNYLCNYGN